MPNGVIDPKGRLARGVDSRRDMTPPEASVPDFPFKHKERTFKRSGQIEAVVFKLLSHDELYYCVADYKGTKVLVIKNEKSFSLKLRRRILLNNRNEIRRYSDRSKEYLLNCFDLVGIV